YRRRHPRGGHPLALDAVQLAFAPEDQVDLGALMRRPERSFGVRFGGQHLLDSEALPRRPELRVMQELRLVLDAEKLVEQTAVANVDLWRFDLPFAQIGVPWLQLAKHQCVGQ